MEIHNSYTVNKLDFDPNNEKFTFESRNEFTHFNKNFPKNFYLVFKLMLKELVKSKLFWILVVTVGILMLFVFENTLSQNYVDVINRSYEEYFVSYGIYNINERILDLIVKLKMGRNLELLDSLGLSYDSLYDDDVKSFTYIFATNWAYFFGILMPLFSITLIIFPSFILSYRESNLLKSLKMTGVSKIQFFVSYVLTSIFVIIMLFAIEFLIIMPIIHSLIINVNSSQEINVYSYPDQKVNISNYLSQYFGIWYILGNSFSPMYETTFAFILILGTITFILIGYYIGSNFKSSKQIIMLGFGVIFLQVISNFTMMMFNESLTTWTSDQKDFFSVLIFIIFKFLFLITPFTIIGRAIAISGMGEIFKNGDNSLYGYGYMNDVSGVSFYNLTIIIAFILSIIFIVLVIVRFSKITKYETTR